MNATVGCVPYVNAIPLIRTMPAEVDVRLEEPSQLPALLDSGAVEAVLVSSFEALRTPGRVCVDGVAIGSDGPAESVRLFSKVAPEKIRKLALDQSSLTSNHLAQVVLAEAYDVRPETHHRLPDLKAMLIDADAAVLIGDRGLEADATGLTVLDLGEEWTRLTTLPFVWALWTGRGDLRPELAQTLREAKESGVKDLDANVEQAIGRRGWDRDRAVRYLSHTMRYDLDERGRQAFELYGQKLAELGLLAVRHAPSWL